AYRRGAKAWVGICEGVFAMDMAQLEQRLTRIEDLEAIKQLKARYCAIADEDHNPDKTTTLFVEDGIWEGGMGTAQGHEAIRQLFQRAQQRPNSATRWPRHASHRPA